MKKCVLFVALLGFSFVFSQNKSIFSSVENLKVDVKSELPKEKTEKYDKQFQNFIMALKNKDKTKVTTLLSEKVKITVNDESLKQLSGGINFDRKIEVYKSGIQTFSNGENLPSLQYKFASDNSNPPKDILTVFFEENGKISGIKPEYSK